MKEKQPTREQEKKKKKSKSKQKTTLKSLYHDTYGGLTHLGKALWHRFTIKIAVNVVLPKREEKKKNTCDKYGNIRHLPTSVAK